MDKKLTISPRFSYLALVLILIGIATFVYGFINDPVKTWANLLVNNYYFLTLALGAVFFWALQHVTQSGWSAAFMRVPMAIGNYIPVAFILMLPVIFGAHHLYEWSHPEALADPLIAHKYPYMNMPFFIIRFVFYFAVWITLTMILRRLALREDKEGGLEYFKKREYFSKVFIFSLALTFSLSAFDWIMSIDIHWFSTIFAVRNFTMAFFHAAVIIAMTVIILNRFGYFPFLNRAHVRDFSKYIFILSIIWTYTWFAQYILIWFANIPEETVYYLPRTKGEFIPLFYLELIVNWLVPFFFLMITTIAANRYAVLAVGAVLMVGQWIDVYNQVMPGTYHHLHINLIDVGTFLGFLGIFAYTVARSLTMAPLVPRHHPYLEESLQHHL